ncbi:hypothetical protein HNW77_06865 [Komagataeibacter sp. AV436]|uniref:Uncharacterized protein n=1 Tax=Komagataeibacter melomenusus TaxID=2766578 RepID=A0ABX2AD34_9PROT|nr:hypothetical protein [Komagataeibacter melomenusus]MBV1830375.1 hypothetical protein [Komagataeibacter melomenusus]NPC66115.1 hypothetical protein [Komagataeibacter melomenusus]
MRRILGGFLAVMAGYSVQQAHAGSIYYKYPDGTILTSGSTQKDLCVISNDNEQLSLYSKGGEAPNYFLKYAVNYEMGIYEQRNILQHVNSDFRFKFLYQDQPWGGIGHDLKDDKNHLYQLDMNPDNSRAFLAQLMSQQSINIQMSLKDTSENNNSGGLIGNLISSAKKKKWVDIGNMDISWPNFSQYVQHFQDCITNKGPAPGWTQRIDPEVQQQQQEQKNNAMQAAYNNALDVRNFLAYGSEVLDKNVNVKGSIYCRDLDSCNIIDSRDQAKTVWFNPRSLSVPTRQRLLTCDPYSSNSLDTNSICSVILSGVAHNVSVVQNGQRVVQPGINATNIRFLSMDEITNSAWGSLINQFGGR